MPMKRLLIALMCFFSCTFCFAQKPEDPASSDDVIQLLRTMQSHDMMQKTMEAMMKPMEQMMHEQAGKDKEKLPPDFDTRMNKMMADMMKNLPFDEMMQAMIPAYQKHFTHGDVEALSAFYSSPVGQKFLEESPKVTGEAMQAIVPIITRYSQQWQERMRKEIKEMQENSPSKPASTSSPQS
jgi:hypothetical protein